MPFNPIGRFVSSGGVNRKNDFRRPVTFYDRVRFVGAASSIEIFGGVLTGSALTIQADLISGDWDGAVPLQLPDGTATAGYALEFDTGIGQFTALYAKGEHVTDLVAAEITVGQLTTAQIEDLAINVDKIADNAVEVAKVADLAIATGKLALDAVTDAQLADLAVGNEHIQALSITAAEIAANTITAAQIAANTITATEIFANTITAGEIAADTITATEIAAGTITATEILANTITAAEIEANTITASEIAANTITGTEIDAGTITTQNLVIGSSDNMIDDPGFESQTKDFFRFNDGGGGTWTVADTGVVVRSGEWAAKWSSNGGTGNSDSIYTNLLASSCSSDEKHMVSVWVRPDSSFNRSLQLRLRYFQGTTLLQDTGNNITPTNGVQTQIVHTATAPAGADSVEGRLRITGAAVAAGALYVDDWEMRRRAGTFMIEDQAVDIARMLDPVFVDGDEDKTSATLKFAGQTDVHTTSTITVPTWVGSLTVFAVGMFHNRWGFTQRVDLYVKIAGGPATQATNTDVIANEVNATIGADAKVITSPGATVTVEITGGTSSNDELTVNVQSVYTATGLR